MSIVDANHRNVHTITSFDGLRFLFKCLEANKCISPHWDVITMKAHWNF